MSFYLFICLFIYYYLLFDFLRVQFIDSTDGAVAVDLFKQGLDDLVQTCDHMLEVFNSQTAVHENHAMEQ